VQPVDLIFVMAGLPERKQYALELYRAGMAPRLVLSVGRYEVSKMDRLPIGQQMAELRALRDSSPPHERHFFVELSAAGVRIEKVRLPRWNTCGEVWAMLRLVEREGARRVTIVSTGVHLRRVAFTIRKLDGRGAAFSYCAVPERLQPIKRERWWTRPADRRFVVKEALKLAGYRLILSMPRWAWMRIFGFDLTALCV
jgi:hypothetical protein